MVLQGLRTRAQLDRLVTLLILNSLPIAFYGMLQRYQLDPLPWGGDTTERVAGNMGNAIFIAAYLIMTFFLTLIRIADAFIAVMTSEQARISDVVRAACYIFIALLNAFVVLILSGSRGPQLGWMAGLFFSVAAPGAAHSQTHPARWPHRRRGLGLGRSVLALSGVAQLPAMPRSSKTCANCRSLAA